MQTTQASQADAPIEYAGFWIRVGATLIDSLLIMLVTVPLTFALYGSSLPATSFGAPIGGSSGDFFISFVLPAVAVIGFWIARQATPGKMLLGMRIVDARTGGPLSNGQSVGRYFAYFISTIPLCLGFLWVALDARKQGWHDKLAGTVVIRTRKGPQAVHFDAPASQGQSQSQSRSQSQSQSQTQSQSRSQG